MENNDMKMNLLKGLMGEEGAQAVEMMQRVERLRRIMGNSQTVQAQEAKTDEMFGGSEISAQEKIIHAALPYVDRGFQREMYFLSRMLEMQRMMRSGGIEAREETPQADAEERRSNMLQAIRPFLREQEQGQIDMMMKVIQIRRIMDGGKAD